MEFQTEGDPLTISTYGFNVPCRRFLVTANVTRDRRIPIVDEFVLRILKLFERVPVKRLGAFFGFSPAEIEIVIADLLEREIVVVEQDHIALHPSSHEMFRGSEGGVPRMIEIEPWVDRIWFDLVSKNMMAPDRRRPLKNLIDLPSDSEGNDMPISFVRKAFEENFPDYLKRVKRITSPERFSLYSVSEVEAERFGSIIIKGTEDLVLDPQPQIRPRLFEVEIENFAQYRNLTNAMSDAYRMLSWPDPSGNSLEEFGRFIGDSSVQISHRDGLFDLRGWLSLNQSIRTDWRAIIGSSYVKRNIDHFTTLIESRTKQGSVETNPKQLSLLWFRPVGTAWGTSPDLQDAIVAIRAAARTSLSKAVVRTTIIIPAVARRENVRRFDGIFDEGYVAPAGYFSPALEVILLENMAALILVQVALSPSVSTTVGYATTDKNSVLRVQNAIQWTSTKSRADELWHKARHVDEVDASFDDDAG